MESNVLSWNQALKKGYEPKLYTYQKKDIPLGEYAARLDFKIWAKKTGGIGCYFTRQDTGMKFQLTVYRRQKDHSYRLNGGDIDFRMCPILATYYITIDLNSKGNIRFKKAAF